VDNSVAVLLQSYQDICMPKSYQYVCSLTNLQSDELTAKITSTIILPHDLLVLHRNSNKKFHYPQPLYMNT